MPRPQLPVFFWFYYNSRNLPVYSVNFPQSHPGPVEQEEQAVDEGRGDEEHGTHDEGREGVPPVQERVQGHPACQVLKNKGKL